MAYIYRTDVLQMAYRCRTDVLLERVVQVMTASDLHKLVDAFGSNSITAKENRRVLRVANFVFSQSPGLWE